MKRQYKDWIAAYLQYTDDTEPSVLYREWVAYSVVAAALRRKCKLSWGHENIYPNLYVVLVGPSGARKGTAMGVGQHLLESIGIQLAADAVTREALISNLERVAETDIHPASNTMELHSSLTAFSAELIVFLGYSNNGMLPMLCDWFDCRPRWKYETKNSGTNEIIGTWFNLIGATTPDLIKTALPQEAIGGGFLSRVILVYADKKAKTVPFPFLSAETAAMGDYLMKDLEKISIMRGKFQITDGFIQAYGDWYNAQEGKPPFPDNNNFDGYQSRRALHIRKMCMILSAARSEDMVIDSTIFKDAQALLERTEELMPNVFAGYGPSVNAVLISRVKAFIETHGSVTLTQLIKAFIAEADSIQHLEGVLETLEKAQFIRLTISPSTGKTTITPRKQ